MGELYDLTELNLAQNQLSGPVPPELGQLRSLDHLNLGGNHLTGQLPPELGNLFNLEEFHLWENRLTGRIPPELGNLRKLVSLVVDRNFLRGEIPSELGGLSNLVTLSMRSNRLSGSIPPELGKLQLLELLRLDDNELSGSIPPELGNLRKLWRLELSGNDLTGRIPPNLGNLNQLEDLNLEHNDFSDCVPWLLELNPTPDDEFYDDYLTVCPNPSVVEGETIRFYIPHLVYDTGLEGDYLSHNSVSNAVNGEVTLTDETIIYEHDGSETTTGGFSYTLSNGFLRLSADVVVDVLPGNDPPIGVPDRIAVDEGGVVSLVASELLANDWDTENDALMLTGVEDAINGTVQLIGSTITYTHDGSNTLEGSFAYTVSDGSSSSKVVVVVVVSPTNDPPVVGADMVAVEEGGTVRLHVSELLSNDVDLEGDEIELKAVGDPTNGSVLLEDNVIIYRHDGSETVTGSFTYTTSDGVAESIGEVVVDVSPVNDPPMAVSDSVQVDEGGDVVIQISQLIANDIDPDSETLSVTSVADGVNGIAFLVGTAAIFEHDGSESTSAGFTYTLSDGVDSEEGEVIVNVSPVNDRPVATTDRFVLDQGGALSIFASELVSNDLDADGDTLRVSAVSNEVNGSIRLESAVIVYQHDGSNTTKGGFTYSFTDGTVSETGDVIVDVTPVNKSPRALPDRLEVIEGDTLLVDASALLKNDNDPDADTLTVTAVGNAIKGRVRIEGNNIAFEHDGSEGAEGGFTYTVSDGLESDSALVSVSVLPKNDPPIAEVDIVTVNEGGILSLDMTELLANDVDVEGDTLQVVAVGDALNGSVRLEGDFVIYEHDDSESTSGGFVYTISDGAATATSRVSVSVTPINDPPVAGIDVLQVDEGGVALAFVSEFLANDSDVDGESLQLIAVGSPLNGRVVRDGNTVTFEHDGSESVRGGFNYTLSDGVETVIGQVQLEVRPTNDAPVPNIDRFQVDEGGKLIVDVWELVKNDTDDDGDVLEIVSVGNALNGQVQLNGNQVRYQHDGSETTSGGFEYVITDGSATVSGEAQVDVVPTGDFPVILIVALVAGVGLAAMVLFILIRVKRSL